MNLLGNNDDRSVVLSVVFKLQVLLQELSRQKKEEEKKDRSVVLQVICHSGGDCDK